MFPVNASKLTVSDTTILCLIHYTIHYLISAPSWVPEDINIGAPATEPSEIMIDTMSSVVVVLYHDELESID